MTASTARRTRPLALAGWVALGVLLIAGLPLAMNELTTLTQYVPYAAVGGFLAIQRPGNAIGWLLIGIGFAFIGTTTPPWVDIAALEAGTPAPQDLIYAWVSEWSGGASFLLYAALAMTFPTGHLPSGRWRRPSIAALALGVVVIGVPAFLRTLRFSPDGVTEILVLNPVGLLPDPGPEGLLLGMLIGTLIPIAVLASAVVGLVVRYRQSGGVVRLQIRWLLAAMAFLVLSVVLGLTVFVASGQTAWFAWVPALIAYPIVPIAVGVAVMRYRLFEIDRLISRTISYVGVSAVLFAVYASVTLTIQSALGSAVGNSALTVAVSTLAVAALFNPLRLRVQRVVDRRFNRSRYDQERAVEAFAAGLRNEVDVERLLGQVRAAVTDALEPTSLTIWRREPKGHP